MFSKHYKTIIAVHDDDVYWLSADLGDQDWRIFQIPLEQLLNDENPLTLLPDWLKGTHKALCIFPDHWFGSQSFPFQSGKASLIEPFLERKLVSAHPGQKSIRQFFNYRRTGKYGQWKLSVFYLQEDKSFQLYNTLRILNHSPQQITAPAFLWEEALGQSVEDFGRLGTLVVHHTGRECQLYFYHLGLYQFSRSIMLADGDEGLEALGYEINQSLYMFSQRAKNDLDRIYIYCDSDQCREKLCELLDREVINLKPLMASKSSEIPDLPRVAILNGCLRGTHLRAGSRFFNIMHRELKRVLEWWPVQWAGVAIGLALTMALIGEHLVLRNMHNSAEAEYYNLQQGAISASSSMGLSEYPYTLDSVLNKARRSIMVDKVHRLPGEFPKQVKLKKLELAADPESTPTLNLTVLVEARNAEALQGILQQFMAMLKKQFEEARNLTLSDFNIGLSETGSGRRLNHYQIDFTLELT